MARTMAAVPMLSRTHGQTASPTTVGKEIAKVQSELEKVRAKLADTNFTSKVPQKVLDDHTQREADWSTQLAKLKTMLEALG